MTKSSRPRSVVAQERKEKVAAAIVEGKTPMEAAAAAGYANPKGSAGMHNHPEVKQAVAIARSEIMEKAKITQGEIIDGIIEAIGLAKLAADPGSMIRGYSEIAKICGLNAPEKKIVEHNISGTNRLSKYEIMTDEELLALTEGTTIDGEATRIQ